MIFFQNQILENLNFIINNKKKKPTINCFTNYWPVQPCIFLNIVEIGK